MHAVHLTGMLCSGGYRKRLQVNVRDSSRRVAGITEAIMKTSAAPTVVAARQLTSCHTACCRVRIVMKISSKFATEEDLHEGEVHRHATGFSIGLACVGHEGA